jgi:UDP-N-acetylmuramyl pentapeptide phosphotransferase/UDP-N-acetylglucosamine-1-phosphate transferase
MRIVFFVPLLSSALIAAIAMLACVGILWILLRTGLAWRLATDVPNERSLHERPTPRVGGWGVVPAVAVCVLFMAPQLWVVAVCAALLAAISQLDDRRGLPARVRFAAHTVAVVIVVTLVPAPIALWLRVIVAIALIWLTNLYNFMDGADGLAGGMAFFGFGGYALAASLSAHADPQLALTSAAVCGAAAGFLLFNFHPARIFLGDAGSIPLGFLAGALGYWGWGTGVWPMWFPVMAFAPFIADASVTLAKRLARGEKFWQAHREHYYQRMVRSGIGHARTAIHWYVVMALGIMLALVAIPRSAVFQWTVVMLWAGVLVAIGMVIDARWRRVQSNSNLSRQAQR